MDNMTILEMAKELSKRAETIGRLETTIEMKDRVIAGLLAQLSLGISISNSSRTCDCGNSNSEEKLKAHVKAVDIPDPVIVSPIHEESTAEPVVEKKKMGRPKGSTNAKKSVAAVTDNVKEKTLAGGSVFKDFVPLELDNLVGTNTSAFMSKKEDARVEVLSAV